ncbi:unnamed protein product [Acanthoscelides obtectus]|uniref:Uncharacterized protein n=1 Tax=Acanthoscelides obtectus TaxID=200917 RepID=A0A9P0LUU5_ACAOB|nr:unnamed protein product [Acanthoscelides obtectus]CAK1620822.1 hypothetical protein AOBTE_LOCUS589 [Acanthoscelides obtectus]
MQEELTELSTNEELKVQFKNGYQQFWLQNNIPVTYPVILLLVYVYEQMRDNKINNEIQTDLRGLRAEDTIASASSSVTGETSAVEMVGCETWAESGLLLDAALARDSSRGVVSRDLITDNDGADYANKAGRFRALPSGVRAVISKAGGLDVACYEPGFMLVAVAVVGKYRFSCLDEVSG